MPQIVYSVLAGLQVLAKREEVGTAAYRSCLAGVRIILQVVSLTSRHGLSRNPNQFYTNWMCYLYALPHNTQ